MWSNLQVLRLLIPTFKSTYKIASSNSHPQNLIQKQKPLRSSALHSLESATLPPLLEYELPPGDKKAASETEGQSEQLTLEWEDTQASTASHLQRNSIEKRVKSVQYQANAPCEDSIVFDQLKALNAYTVSIFDGHGGPELAQYSKERINSLIDSYLKQHLSNKQKTVSELLKDSLVWSYRQLEDSFFEIYEQHLKLGNKKLRSVGACGITAIVHDDRVYIGNAGDSMGMFILAEGETYRSQKTNERLSVNSRAQRDRIREKWKGKDDDIISEESNNCFYLKGRLQPTRTLGDYYLKKQHLYNGQGPFQGPYLQCEPDVNQFKITPAHRFMVLASDGLWDVLSKSEVLEALMNGNEIDLSKTCYEEIREEESPYVGGLLESVLGRCGQACGRSVEELRGLQPGKRRNYHDDITIAVIDLQNQL